MTCFYIFSHCNFVSNCIGQRNMKQFVCLVFSTFYIAFHIIVVVFMYYVTAVWKHNKRGQPNTSIDNYGIKVAIVTFILISAIVALLYARKYVRNTFSGFAVHVSK